MSASTPTHSPETATSTRDHLAAIDALRGVAALAVVLYHLPIMARPGLRVPPWTEVPIAQGGSAVALFFVISAFTLTLSVRRRGTARGQVMPFYLRRVLRIVPLYYLWLVLSLVRDQALGVSHSGQALLLSLVLGYNLVPGQSSGIVWVSWTLGVEMLFYLAFPLVFRVVRTLSRSLAFLGASLLADCAFRALLERSSLSAQVRDEFFHYSLVHSLPLFAAGMVTFFLYERYIVSRNVPRYVSGLLLAFSGVGLILLTRAGSPTSYWDHALLLAKWHWFGPLYGALALGLITLPWRVVVNPAVRCCGTLSYSIYLNHATIIFCASPLYGALYALIPWAGGAFFVSLFVTLLLVIPFSWLTYCCVEQPFIQLGNRILAKLGREGQKPAVGWFRRRGGTLAAKAVVSDVRDEAVSRAV